MNQDKDKEKRKEQSQDIIEIQKTEIRRAIDKIENDKTPGEDKITGEMLKGGKEEITKLIQILFNEIMKNEQVPEQWTKTIIILLHKKEDTERIENYRPISLMTNMYKIFAHTIHSRIRPTLERSQPYEQAGFRKILLNNRPSTQYKSNNRKAQ
ncbi:hypothetical protein ILUMI_11231 [Ignelater luminosus]|uniref:Reverse transcriptase domain-containing protein n=1 Tax=Ignelater luminosus TaxID=2038154 RepID=A0A8K0G7Y0_IGNLU|nr:hypothetical protein ILUMI_11231 [Ignelater luminosus]